MKHILFICSRNKLRSPTAEVVFAGCAEVACASAGLNHDADVPLTPELVLWADVIFVMETAHRQKLQQRFRPYLQGKRVICLNIPDKYGYMDAALVSLLQRKVVGFLPEMAALV